MTLRRADHPAKRFSTLLFLLIVALLIITLPARFIDGLPDASKKLQSASIRGEQNFCLPFNAMWTHPL